MKIIGVIPARYNSTRFPGKPLAKILGKPMIWWVYNKVKDIVQFDEVYVATENEEIRNYCIKNDIEVIMTSDKHNTGTDRMAEVAEKIEGDLFVNIQGDEPLINPEMIKKLLHSFDNSEVYCGTLKKKIEKHATENITVYGFTDKVSALMDSADLYVTKPGGLSITEAARKRLPLAFIDTVSGCEGYNRYFFLARGLAIASNDPEKLPELIVKRLLNEEALNKQRLIMEKEFSIDPQQVIFDYFL